MKKKQPAIQSKAGPQKYEQLISEYQTKISSILKKNNVLSNEVNDLVNSIYLNRDIISDYLKDYPEYKNIEENLINSIENYLNNINEKNESEMKLNKLEYFERNLPEEVELLQINNEQLKSELYKTLKQIYKLEKEIEKHKKSSIFKIPREEIFVVSPTKKNIELFDNITKLSRDLNSNQKHEIDKREIKLLDAKIQIIEEQVDKLKDKVQRNPHNNISDKNLIAKNIEYISDEEEEIDEFDLDEKLDEGGEGDARGRILKNNGIDLNHSKNADNENLEMIEQIKSFTKEVEKLEKENYEKRKKIKEYEEEYKTLKEEMKDLSLMNNSLTSRPQNNKK